MAPSAPSHLTPLRAPSPRRPPAPPPTYPLPRGEGPSESRSPPCSREAQGELGVCLQPFATEDQVPPLLPLQLRPPPPPSCMTQQNRGCCSKSEPSAQEAPQPGLGRSGGGKAGVQPRGSLGPTLRHKLPLCPWQANEMRFKLTRPSRGGMLGLARRRDGSREEGVKETPVRGRTFQVKKGKTAEVKGQAVAIKGGQREVRGQCC